jgi:NAD(P)-dependent dehydrogenase (short-subunit alcohol dehydrogenase family)
MTAEPLAGKTAFVTGGAQRIGRAIALALARGGADVAISWHASEVAAAKTVTEIGLLGRRAMATQCDVRNEASVRSAVAAVAAEFGRLDILVNNAAIFASAALESLTLDQWDVVFNTNARGPFLVAREALPHLRAARGHIINIGSLGAEHPWAGHAHYCASKAALHMLTQAMAKAFAPEVSVNCVAPGWIEMVPSSTETVASLSPASADEKTRSEGERRLASQAAHFAARTPMGRNGSAEEVAEAVLFFAAGPHFITGQTLAVDGGLGLT